MSTPVAKFEGAKAVACMVETTSSLAVELVTLPLELLTTTW